MDRLGLSMKYSFKKRKRETVESLYIQVPFLS